MQDFFENKSTRRSTIENTVFVPMSGIDVAKATDTKYRIGTSSLASCAGIVIFDDNNKVGGVAHVFFNEKESLIVYQKDAFGRDIPSSGRELIVNNPAPFAPFKYMAEALIAKADAYGGKSYKFYAFNVKYGRRTALQNAELEKVVEEAKASLELTGKIKSFEYRNETEFTLDTRNGIILPRSY